MGLPDSLNAITALKQSSRGTSCLAARDNYIIDTTAINCIWAAVFEDAANTEHTQYLHDLANKQLPGRNYVVSRATIDRGIRIRA